jgi:hypothetical protein
MCFKKNIEAIFATLLFLLIVWIFDSIYSGVLMDKNGCLLYDTFTGPTHENGIYPSRKSRELLLAQEITLNLANKPFLRLWRLSQYNSIPIYVNSFSFVPDYIEHNAKQCFQKEIWAAELFVVSKKLIKLYSITGFLIWGICIQICDSLY